MKFFCFSLVLCSLISCDSAQLNSDSTVADYAAYKASYTNILFSLGADNAQISELPEIPSSSANASAGGKYYKLSLNLKKGGKIDKSIKVFSDRPVRYSGNFRLVPILAEWYEGGTFAFSPPNAALYYHSKQSLEQKAVFVELTKPKLNLLTGELVFQIRALPGSPEIAVEEEMVAVSLFIDSFWKKFKNDFHKFGHDVKRDADKAGDKIKHAVDTASDKVKNGVIKLSDDIAKGSVKVADDIEKAKEKIEHEIVKAADDVKDAMVWFYNHAKCYIIEGTLDTVGIFAEALTAIASDGEATMTWEVFVSAMKETAEKEGAVQLFARGSDKEAGCISGLSDVVFAQAIEWGSFPAFSVDMLKAVILAKAGCKSFLDTCF
jgi:hypothetical protein